MADSRLVTYEHYTKSKSTGRAAILYIAIHHVAGNLNVRQVGQVFDNNEVSAHYAIDNDLNVGQYVRERDTAWALGNFTRNKQSINIELANNGGASTDWHVSDAVIEKCIDLVYDIAKRNKWTYCSYTGDLNGDIIGHYMVAQTACPGPYMRNNDKLRYIASEVDKRLKGITSTAKPTPAPKPAASKKPSRTIADVYNPETPLTAKQAVKAGQAISNIILGTNIAEDGIDGPDTQANRVRILQWAMNRDYLVNIKVDGLVGPLTKSALGIHTVRQGETQYMVTALEVLLLMNGYNPHGVELPGEFGSGLAQCVLQYQMDHSNLTNDRIAGRQTFLQLIK